MQNKNEQIPTTYKDFCTELTKNQFFGAEMHSKVKDIYTNSNNPLFFAIELMSNTKFQLANLSHSGEMLGELRQLAAHLDLIIKDAINTTDNGLNSIIETYCGQKLTLAESKHSIEIVTALMKLEITFEAIIKEAVNTLSAEKLSAINFGSKRTKKIPLLIQLVQFGAEELFYHAFEKLKSELTSSQLGQILDTIHECYHGAEIAEDLNLACSLLKRGDHCFVRMLNFVLESVMKQNKLTEVLSSDDSNSQINLKNDLLGLQKKLVKNKCKYTEEEYISKYSYQRRKDNIPLDLLASKAKKDYKKYFSDTDGQNLFVRSMYNSVQVQIIIDDLMAIKKDDALNVNQKKSSAQELIKTRQTDLNPQSKNLLQSLLEHKIANKELDFLQYNDVRKDEKNTVVDDSPKPQLTRQQQLQSQFFRQYNEKLAEDKTAWCGLYGFFATSNVDKSMSLLALTQHALGSGKRSLEVMKELRWVDENDQLTNEIRTLL